jgi:hypothetical protein
MPRVPPGAGSAAPRGAHAVGGTPACQDGWASDLAQSAGRCARQARFASSVARDGCLALAPAALAPLAVPYASSGRHGAGAGGLTFAGSLCGRSLATTLLAVKLALQAGGEGTLGRQVILQARDVILQT